MYGKMKFVGKRDYVKNNPSYGSNTSKSYLIRNAIHEDSGKNELNKIPFDDIVKAAAPYNPEKKNVGAVEAPKTVGYSGILKSGAGIIAVGLPLVLPAAADLMHGTEVHADQITHVLQDYHALRNGIELGESPRYVTSIGSEIVQDFEKEAWDERIAQWCSILGFELTKTVEERNSNTDYPTIDEGLPHWGQPLSQKTPVLTINGRSYYRQGEFLYRSLDFLIVGGLTPYDSRFIDWQKEVYANVRGSHSEYVLVKDLTESIHKHVIYNPIIAEDVRNSAPYSKFAWDRLSTAPRNNYSVCEVVLNDAGVCQDFALIEHYMLGQQGIYSEVFSLPNHSVVRLTIDSEDYIADPTRRGGVLMKCSDYLDYYNSFSEEKVPVDYKDENKPSSGSLYIKP